MSIYSCHKVAEMFNVCPATVRRWIKTGALGAIQPNCRTIMITQDMINEFIAKFGTAQQNAKEDKGEDKA